MRHRYWMIINRYYLYIVTVRVGLTATLSVVSYGFYRTLIGHIGNFGLLFIYYLPGNFQSWAILTFGNDTTIDKRHNRELGFSVSTYI